MLKKSSISSSIAVNALYRHTLRLSPRFLSSCSSQMPMKYDRRCSVYVHVYSHDTLLRTPWLISSEVIQGDSSSPHNIYGKESGESHRIKEHEVIVKPKPKKTLKKDYVYVISQIQMPSCRPRATSVEKLKRGSTLNLTDKEDVFKGPSGDRVSLVFETKTYDAILITKIIEHHNDKQRKLAEDDEVKNEIAKVDNADCHDTVSWTIEQEAALLKAYIIAKPTPYFWNFFPKMREVQNVMCWQDKIKKGYGIFLFCLRVIMILIISASVTVSKSTTWALTEDHRLFLEAWRTIDRAYIDKTFNGQSWFRYKEFALRNVPMNNREETYLAIKKMLSLLDDPFTRFLEPEKFKSLRSSTQGALTGVGLSIGYPTVHNASSKGLVVISAVPGGPAYKSGVKPGDIILSINDRSTEDMDVYEAADLLQGTEGSSILLDIRSGSEIKHIILRREKITLNPVRSRLCEISGQGNDSSRVGYIKLTSFNQNSSGALRDAIMSLRDSGVQLYVLDLRDNSGGLFAEGIKAAKIWLDKGVIVYICDNLGIRDIYETDGNDAIAASEPLVVLVNRGTASASEILAGALKDNRRAVLYGEPTFGKGKIQSVFELFDGSGLVVTVARYETPAHTDIDKVGIAPDHRLPPLFPIDEDSFCGCLKDPDTACSINSAAFFTW